MSLVKVRAYEPLRALEVVKVLRRGVLLVEGAAVVLAHEGEEAGPLVLPDPRPAAARHHHRLAVRVAAQRGEEVPRRGPPVLPQLRAPLVAPVTLLVVQAPGGARRGVAPKYFYS